MVCGAVQFQAEVCVSMLSTSMAICLSALLQVLRSLPPVLGTGTGPCCQSLRLVKVPASSAWAWYRSLLPVLRTGTGPLLPVLRTFEGRSENRLKFLVWSYCNNNLIGLNGFIASSNTLRNIFNRSTDML